ncbi:MAG: alanine--tRNA ligase [Fimbriimonadaceae bacterium]|nr:alanine--tRNA ligase [Fimbriimonadaceae bacterium]
MTVRELRQKYIEFFKSKGHSFFPSGSLIPYDVTGKLDESLLFNGAGMVQFKPFFRGIAQPPNKRLTNAQKCVRTGDIESVGDLSHLTFFEMLGNFSFGDYFKKEAVAFSWEFLTSPDWLGLNPKRLSFTVFEEDDVAFEAWSEHLRAAGIDPDTRIFRLGEETNYWPAGAFSNGPPGPCGPNSEMFYWTADEPPPTGPYSSEDYLRDEEDRKWLEIWNDVFIQYDWQGTLRDPERPGLGYEKTGLPSLPFQSVDTGMGLERTAAVLGGYKSVYDTDAFTPIIKVIEGLGDGLSYGQDPTKDEAIRIISDHIRTAVFCIADGILPSNNGRGYVLRRLIRRAVLKGQRVLGFDKPFFHLVYEGVVQALGDHYTELSERRDVILETLRNEEAMFRRTVSAGVEQLTEILLKRARNVKQNFVHNYFRWLHATPGLVLPSDQRLSELWDQLVADVHAKRFNTDKTADLVEQYFPGIPGVRNLEEAITRYEAQIGVTPPKGHVTDLSLRLSGAEAFMLYDTFGFPLELTQEICAEDGITIDLDGYLEALKEAQERSRGASGMDTVYGQEEEQIILSVSSRAKPQSEFVGYFQTSARTEIGQISPIMSPEGLTTGEFQFCMNETPFYAQSGGQVGDTGRVSCDAFEFKVTNTWKEMGLIWHDAELVRLDEKIRGQLFGPQGDFNPDPTLDSRLLRGLREEEIVPILESGLFFQAVDAIVDDKRRRDITRNHTATHLLHAALRSVLGRHVTQAGSLVSPEHLRFDFTHGKAMSPEELAEVERIVNERSLMNNEVSIYADVPLDEARRRGAMALFGEKYGDSVRMVQVDDFSLELCGGCHVRSTGEIGLFKILHESSAASGVRRIEAITGHGAYQWVSEQERRVRQAATLLKANPGDLVPAIERTLEHAKDLNRRLEKARTQTAGSGATKTVDVGGVELAVEKMTDGDTKEATLVADRLADGKPSRVVLVGLSSDGKLTFVAKVGPDALAKGAHAGNLVREVAKIAGGGGGGRPDFATAGGRDPSQFEAALEAAESLVAAQLS